MRRNLQSKFNLLGVTLIVFALLMVPMFNQVKADTRDSLREAKHTWMSKMFREVARDFKPRNLENTEVEDYWAEQAKKQDPNCGQACDPNADRDGDGMSNGDEVRAGRNPSCNEDKHGVDYCKGRDPYNLTEDDPVVARAERLLVAHLTWTFSQCTPQPIATSCGTRTFNATVPANVTLMESYLNVTGYSGTQFNLQIRNGNPVVLTHSRGVSPSPQSFPMERKSAENVGPGNYNAQLTFSTAQSGNWELKVYATRVVN